MPDPIVLTFNLRVTHEEVVRFHEYAPGRPVIMGQVVLDRSAWERLGEPDQLTVELRGA